MHLNSLHILINSNTLVQCHTIFTPSLKDDLDTCRCINQANSAFATMKQVLCNKDIPAKLRVRLYDATAIKILLWWCESWVLPEELQRNLELCHHIFLRKMVGITIYYIKDNHISNNVTLERNLLHKIFTNH